MTGPLADPVAHAVVDAFQSPPHMKNRVTSSYIVPLLIIYYTILFSLGWPCQLQRFYISLLHF
jgi:hypothetical protein